MPSGPNLGAAGFRCYAQWNSPWGVRASAEQVLTVWSAVNYLVLSHGLLAGDSWTQRYQHWYTQVG